MLSMYTISTTNKITIFSPLQIKLWRLPSSGTVPSTGITAPELTLPQQPRRVETVNFNPSADSILATSSSDTLTVWDVVQGKELYTFAGHGDEVQSVGWQTSGRLLATQCKDKMLRVVDPRLQAVEGAAMECESHQGIKDSKVVWVGHGSDRILTTGFSGVSGVL
jgi:WD40 repeat protein